MHEFSVLGVSCCRCGRSYRFATRPVDINTHVFRRFVNCEANLAELWSSNVQRHCGQLKSTVILPMPDVAKQYCCLLTNYWKVMHINIFFIMTLITLTLFCCLVGIRSWLATQAINLTYRVSTYLQIQEYNYDEYWILILFILCSLCFTNPASWLP